MCVLIYLHVRGNSHLICTESSLNKVTCIYIYAYYYFMHTHSSHVRIPCVRTYIHSHVQYNHINRCNLSTGCCGRRRGVGGGKPRAVRFGGQRRPGDLGPQGYEDGGGAGEEMAVFCSPPPPFFF